MPLEDRKAFFLNGAQQIWLSGKGAAALNGRRGRRFPLGPHSDTGLEYRRWANALLQDHELLRQLLARFECALDSMERASLFHLAVEFHEAHQCFEQAWDPAPELDAKRLELDQMIDLIEHLKPDGLAWNAMARAWSAKLRTLMDSEDRLYCGERERKQQFAGGRPTDLLERRLSRISEVRKVLQG
jgi:hypothetical protein